MGNSSGVGWWTRTVSLNFVVRECKLDSMPQKVKHLKTFFKDEFCKYPTCDSHAYDLERSVGTQSISKASSLVRCVQQCLVKGSDLQAMFSMFSVTAKQRINHKEPPKGRCITFALCSLQDTVMTALELALQSITLHVAGNPHFSDLTSKALSDAAGAKFHPLPLVLECC